MNILDHLEAARTELEERHAREIAEFNELHTRARQLFAGGVMTQTTKSQAPLQKRRGRPPGAKKQRIEADPDFKRAVGPKVGGRVSDIMRSVIKNWSGRGFTAAELRERIFKAWPNLKEKSAVISVNLINMVERGELMRDGKGSKAVYSVRVLKGTEETETTAKPTRKKSKPAVVKVESPVQTKPATAGKFRAPRIFRGKLVDAIRVVLVEWNPEKFTRAEVQERVIAKFPEHAGKEPMISQTLLGMLDHGELTREGQGGGAFYSVVKLAGSEPVPVSAPTPKENAWRELRGTIEVPRDLDTAQME
jgi:hypothetical protein